MNTCFAWQAVFFWGQALAVCVVEQPLAYCAAQVGMRHFNVRKNQYFCPIINLDKLWSLVGHEVRAHRFAAPAWSLCRACGPLTHCTWSPNALYLLAGVAEGLQRPIARRAYATLLKLLLLLLATRCCYCITV